MKKDCLKELAYLAGILEENRNTLENAKRVGRDTDCIAENIMQRKGTGEFISATKEEIEAHLPMLNGTHMMNQAVTGKDLAEKSDTLNVTQFSSGTKRSSIQYRRDLLDPSYLNRCTNNLEFGAEKYGEGNWKRGVILQDRDYLLDACNHLIVHVDNIVSITKAFLVGSFEYGGISEDDIAHASFNLMILSKYWDSLNLTAEAFRPIYQKRIEEWKASQQKS